MLAASTGAERRTNFERRMHRRAQREQRARWSDRLRAAVRGVNRRTVSWILRAVA